jgi:uncharacterized protein (UPF0261 family)
MSDDTFTPTACVIGTLDTKGAEFAFLCDRLRELGVRPYVIDCGTGGPPHFEPDVPAIEVAEAACYSLRELLDRQDRGECVEVMSKGAAVITRRLFREGKIQGVISLGGSAGTTIGTSAMRALPVGVPKVMVSTLASGDVRPYVGTRDICMMYSVVDISGLNRVSRAVLSNAAAALAGMALAPPEPSEEDRPLVAATMFGVTTPCVTAARGILEEAGFEVLVFHATGSGGRAMEDLARDGYLVGILDLTTTELADELVGGVLSAGPERLEAAGELGLPQVVAPGALDMVNFGPRDTVPEAFRGRSFYQHNPTVTLMRTTPEENAELGRIVAEKLNAARGPVVVLLPLQGVSAIDAEGKPFHWPVADAAFRDALRRHLRSEIPVEEHDLHINDPAFAHAAAQTLLRLLPQPGQAAGQ